VVAQNVEDHQLIAPAAPKFVASHTL